LLPFGTFENKGKAAEEWAADPYTQPGVAFVQVQMSSGDALRDGRRIESGLECTEMRIRYDPLSWGWYILVPFAVSRHGIVRLYLDAERECFRHIVSMPTTGVGDEHQALILLYV
jgi:hypothetical protein